MEGNKVDILLEIISPEKTLVHRMVGEVEFPGTKGRFEVLKDHAPLVSSLEKGDIVFSSGGKQERLAIASGFVEIYKNHVTACVEL